MLFTLFLPKIDNFLSFILRNFLVRVLPCADFFSNFFAHGVAFVWQFQYCPKRPNLPRKKESKGLFELFAALYIHIFGKQMTALTDASYSKLCNAFFQ